MKKLTLIIATYNRSTDIIRTLQSVVAQTCPAEQWECIVVNNNSTDDTAQALENYAIQHSEIDIKPVFEQQQGLSHARNRGIKEAEGELVAIIDDDELINPEFIQAYIDFFDSKLEVVAAGGKIIAEYIEQRPKWMSRYTEQPIANPIDLGKRYCQFPKGRVPGGGNMAIRSSALAKYGAFDVNLGRTANRPLGGEEVELFERLKRAGEQVWYVPNAVMWHLIPPQKLTNEYFDKLTYNIGIGQRLRYGMPKVIIKEWLKWWATILIAKIYVITFRASQAKYLLRMRRNITKGILQK